MGILKKNYLLLVIQIIVTLLCTSCIHSKNLRKFNLYNELINIDSSILKIDGIYSAVESKKTNEFRNYDQIRCFALYENGIYLDLLADDILINKRQAIDSLIWHFEKFKKLYSNTVRHWGAYNIVDDTLSIQRFTEPYGVFFTTSYVYEYRMKILNDSTLVQFEKADDGHTVNRVVYELFKTDEKPDSTNLFITNKRIKARLDRLYKKRHSND